MTSPDVVVAGGGVAGLAVATMLAERGAEVWLLERRGRLGGRAYSFADPGGTGELDNGQHVFLGCCSELIRWLARIGSLDRAWIQPRARIPFLLAGGEEAWIEESPLPAPLTFLPSLLGYAHLGWSDRCATVRILSALTRASEGERAAWGDISFSTLLARLGGSPQSVRRFWEPVVVSAANERPNRVAADIGALVFRETLAAGRAAVRFGIARRGLSDLLARPAREYLDVRGGRVLFRRRVARIRIEEGRVVGVVCEDGSEIPAGTVVCALAWDDLLRVLPPPAADDPFFARIGRLRPSPILGIHLWLDRPALKLPFVGFLESPLHWVFNHGPRLSLIVSGAHDWIGRSRGEVVAAALAEIRRFLPAAREARLERSVVLAERRATFSPVPRSRRWRAPAATPVRGLYLAGAWTDTGWPATLEGAVRSARACVEAIHGTPHGTRNFL